MLIVHGRVVFEEKTKAPYKTHTHTQKQLQAISKCRTDENIFQTSFGLE